MAHTNHKVEKSFKKVSGNVFMITKIQTDEHMVTEQEAKNIIAALTKKEEQLVKELEMCRKEKADFEAMLASKGE